MYIAKTESYIPYALDRDELASTFLDPSATTYCKICETTDCRIGWFNTTDYSTPAHKEIQNYYLCRNCSNILETQTRKIIDENKHIFVTYNI